MADVPLYEGDTIIILWFGISHECQVYRSDEVCHLCCGATIRLDPPCSGWTLLCTAESALTTTTAQHKEAIDNLQPGAIGVVSSMPVRVYKKENQQCQDA
jgi:hypothetical protein